MANVTDDNLYVNTDDYDLYNSQGVPESLPGSPGVDASGHLIIPTERFFPPSTTPNSSMDKDPNNTGPMTDFYHYMPVVIDTNGFIFYYDENTGVNLRGPAGAPRYVRFSDLTPEDIEVLKGQDGADGINGINGTNGRDGVDGLDAYHVWLRDNGYSEDQHPISEFYDYLAGYQTQYIKEGTGQGSLIVNYRGLQNTAAGAGAFASGQNTAASGSNSFTAGLGTVAASANQFALGKYNNNKSTNIFEIGSGISANNRSNCFEVTAGGSLKVSGSITDGNNNILSNKVDKINGKSLSTNDFTNAYKNFIDNYHIEATVNETSQNPVTSAAIYTALQNLQNTISSKPSAEVGNNNSDYSMLAYRYINDNNLLEMAVKMTGFTWNPNKKILHIGDNNTTANNVQHSYVLGLGLESNSNNQIILGKYNTPIADDLLQIGNGASSVNTNNLLRITKTGNLIISGDITDGNGNTLSNKQDELQYDTIPINNSDKVMTSGAIYNTLVNVGIIPGVGINIPAVTTLQNQMTIVNASLTSLDNRVTTLEAREMIDEATNEPYIMGIRNGKLYIQKKEETIEENNNAEEEEQNVNNE